MTLLICLIFIFLDQILKWLTLGWGWSFVNFNLAWGLTLPFSIAPVIFLIISLLSAFLIAEMFLKKHFFRSFLFLRLMIAGGISNLLDRLLRGGVVDYLHLPFWPSFNLADLMITVGFLLFIKELFLTRNRR